MTSNRPVYVAGLERGVRPIGDWSTWMILSSWLSPRIVVWRPGFWRARCRRLPTALKSTSLTSVDLPEPLTPVTAVITPSGTFTSMLFRLFAAAPRISTQPDGVCRWAGMSMTRVRARNWPVSDSATASMSAALPCATISPPCSPAPGPMSTMWSAARIVCSSCSTTMTVLPSSRSRSSVAMSFALSRWCRPIDGSSRMYSTPTSDEPIWVARRIRCASPPLSVAAARSIDR